MTQNKSVKAKLYTVAAFLINEDGSKKRFAFEAFSTDASRRDWIRSTRSNRESLTSEKRKAEYKLKTWVHIERENETVI